MNSKIAVIGTGYVGLVSAACFADQGWQVVCVDKDEEKIRGLERGVMPIYEAGLEGLCNKNFAAGRLEFTCDIGKAVQRCEYIVIAVGTPPMDDGSVDMSAVYGVARSIGYHINGYKVVINKSTVPVGTQQKVCEIIAESGANCDFDVVSNPEFLREGTAVYDLQHTDRIIIGVDGDRAKAKMLALYMHSDTYKMITDPISAEMLKYASNAFLATKITFINETANLCDRVGADVNEVAKGMGLDKRIAPYFLNAGIGFGGGCFPKDMRALLRLSEGLGYEFKILEAVVSANERQKQVVADKVKAALGGEVKGKKIAVWGLSFKAGTNDVRGSVGIEIVHELKRAGAAISAYDPKAMEDAKRLLDVRDLEDNMYDALDGADILLVLTEWEEFRNADFNRIKRLLRRPIILDGRNCLDRKDLKDLGFTYIGMGR